MEKDMKEKLVDLAVAQIKFSKLADSLDEFFIFEAKGIGENFEFRRDDFLVRRNLTRY